MFIFRLLRAAGFQRLLGFVSPAFFDVVPAGAMLARGRTLLAAYRDARAFEKARDERSKRLSAAGLEVELAAAPTPSGPADEFPLEQRRSVGEAVLRLYFHQLLTDGPTLLDLSAAKFRGSHPVQWSPGPGHVEWDPAFQSALRQIYVGFYTDDGAVMVAGLSELGLESAEPLFRKHFGEGDQSAVTFSVDHFVSSFHAVFTHCKEQGIRLHPDFLPLGVYLASLYEHLQGIGAPLDVRSAFVAADRTSGRH